MARFIRSTPPKFSAAVRSQVIDVVSEFYAAAARSFDPSFRHRLAVLSRSNCRRPLLACRAAVDDRGAGSMDGGGGRPMRSVQEVTRVEVGSAAQLRRAPAPSEGGDASLSQEPGSTGGSSSAVAISDDLSREVYCILGMPIDAVEMPAVLRSIETAAAKTTPFVISTPNLHFLVNTQNDPEFRESLLFSDLCPTDGMPIVWIARLTGIPIKGRIAGSDIFEALKSRHRTEPLKVYLFGSKENIAAAAARNISAKSAGLVCVGWTCPGFGTVDALSEDHFIDEINSSGADFLVAAVGAKKGQVWLQRNHRRLKIPIRAHLGATINFQAATVKRAPYALQKLGLEWLWRIKEEPYLWRRYWHDGGMLLRLTLTHLLPLAISERSLRRRCKRNGHDLVIERAHDDDSLTLNLSGFAIANQVDKAILCFRAAIKTKKQIVINFSGTRAIDARFLGLLLMLRKQLKTKGGAVKFMGISRPLGRMFRLNGLGYLLPSGESL